MRLFTLLLSVAMLTACMEPQPAPELPERPSTDFNVEVVADGLAHPWSVAELPDGRYLVTEKADGLLLLDGEDRQRVRWAAMDVKAESGNVPSDLLSAGQGGMFDVVPAPDFGTPGTIYVAYAAGTTGSNRTALARGTLDGTSYTHTTILRAGPPKSAAQHFGGRIVVLPDETVLLTLGDGFAFREDAQKPDTHLGKILRVDRMGRPVADNPFTGQDDTMPEIFSLGHRNVQGLAYDAETDTIWEHEHGPRGGDELNIITPGANYGWPIATTGVDYSGAKISPFETYDGMVDPVHDWVPSIAPSGLAIYRGDMFPDWNGDALVGGLASRDLRRVDLENGKAVGEFDLLSDLNARIRDVRVARDGAILVLTDDPENGQLLRITPKGR